MPSRGGARSTSRKNVPVSPPKRGPTAPLPNTAPRRSTRGQSQDVDAPDTSSILQTVTRATRNILQAVDPDLLPAVNEVTDDDFEDEQENLVRSSSPLSDGAQTTNTQMNRLHANREDMIDALPVLHQDANALLFLVAGSDLEEVISLNRDLTSEDESISNASKRVKGRYENLRKNFELSREPFEESDVSYINIPNVILTLAGVQNVEELEGGSWRPDPVLQLANVAQLVASAMRIDRADEEADGILDHINNVFPTPFVPDVNHISSETIALGLEIRNQRCIRQLYDARYEADFDPDIVTRGIWFGDDGKERPFDLIDNTAEVPKKWRAAFTAKINRIRRHFSTENVGANNGINFDTIEQEFSWSAFLGRLAVWADHRAKELNKLIEAQGGPEVMQKLMRGESAPMKAPRKKRQSLAEKRAELARDMEQVEADKEAQRAAQEAAIALGEYSQNHNEIQESPNRAESLILTGNEIPLEPPVPTQETNMIWETVDMNNRQANKENIDAARRGKASFIDYQPGAHRVNFEDNYQGANDDDAPGHSRKRHHQAQATDDDDEAFQEDPRPQRTPKRPRKNLRQTGYHDVGGVEDPDPQAPNYQLAAAASASQPSPRQVLTPRRPRPLPSSAPDPGRHPISPLPGAPGLHRNGGPQIRIPFSAEESARLIELIEQYGNGKTGISWALLEKKDREHSRGALLQRRGQVGLKDKARNMKMDFLKQRGDVGLPVNFNLIPLGNRLIDQLDRMGVSHRER